MDGFATVLHNEDGMIFGLQLEVQIETVDRFIELLHFLEGKASYIERHALLLVLPIGFGVASSRNETILSIHIRTDEYNIFIFPDAITIRHKYISVQSTHFTIGKWRYNADALDTFNGNERKRLFAMYDVLNELLTECRIDGVLIDDWKTSRIIATHLDT